MIPSFRILMCTFFFVMLLGQPASAAPVLRILYTANSWGHSAPVRA